MASKEFTKKLKEGEVLLATLRKETKIGRRTYSPKSVIACGGIRFVQGIAQPVPLGAEAEAQNNPYLDIEIVSIDSLASLEDDAQQALAYRAQAARDKEIKSLKKRVEEIENNKPKPKPKAKAKPKPKAEAVKQ